MDRYDLIVRELSALIGQTCHLWHELHCLGGEQLPFRLVRQTHTHIYLYIQAFLMVSVA